MGIKRARIGDVNERVSGTKEGHRTIIQLVINNVNQFYYILQSASGGPKPTIRILKS